MPVGRIKNEGDLRRFVEAELRRPGAVPPAAPAVSLIKKGVPSDADFPQTPGDGILAVDTTLAELPVLYGRVSGKWQAL